MSEFWKSFITQSSYWAIVAAAAIFLIKSLISQFLNKDIEIFKSRLKAEADIATEQLKAQLKMTAYENEVKFLRLHEERAEVIKNFYVLLVGLEFNAYIFVQPGSIRDRVREKETVSSMEELALLKT